MPDVPQPLADLMASLTLDGIPPSATPGDRLTPRLTPSLAPGPAGLPEVLTALTRAEVLAVIDVDPSALVTWLVSAVGVEGWAKNVEFDQPIGAPATALPNPSPIRNALRHLIPAGNTPALSVSSFVQGLIGRLNLTRDTAAGAVGRVTGTLSRPGLVGTMTQPTVEVRVFDETGVQLTNGNGFFQSSDFVPSLVFLPVAVSSVALQPTIRRTVSVRIALSYTPPVTGASPIPVIRDFGPFAIDLATIEVPRVALLARHALTTATSAPGHVFVGVPASSPLNSLGDVITALSQLRTVLSNVVTVLGAFGVPAPTSLTDAVRALAFVPTVAGDFRFGKGDLLGLWALFADWQFIMSAAMVFGPSSQRAFFGTISPQLAGFSLFPAVLGVGFIPDLNTAITGAATVGTVVDNIPLVSGTYDNRLTSINFPAS